MRAIHGRCPRGNGAIFTREDKRALTRDITFDHKIAGAVEDNSGRLPRIATTRRRGNGDNEGPRDAIAIIECGNPGAIVSYPDKAIGVESNAPRINEIS